MQQNAVLNKVESEMRSIFLTRRVHGISFSQHDKGRVEAQISINSK